MGREGAWVWWLLMPGCRPAEELPPPAVRLVTPVDDTTVCGVPFHLVVEVDNYELIDFDQPEASIPGVGHVDIKLNGQNRWMTPDLSFDIPEVDDGVYLVEAVLVDGEHHAIEPYTAAEAQVTVDSTVCGSAPDTGASSE